MQQDSLIHAKLDTIASLVGAVYHQMGQLIQEINRLSIQTQSPEQKAQIAEAAKKRLEELKQEAENELEHLLEERSKRGIGDNGNAVTEADLAELE